MENQYGPQTICQRTKCAEVPPHKAGRHLDQRDDLYDGPGPLFQVLPLAVRESARKIAREHPDVMPEVVDMAQHIQSLRDQVTHVRVDKDHAVSEAMARSESCEHHGTEIRLLGEQLHAISESDRRNDQGRVALLGMLHAVNEFVRGAKAGRLREETTVATLLEMLETTATRTHRAHERAWKR